MPQKLSNAAARCLCASAHRHGHILDNLIAVPTRGSGGGHQSQRRARIEGRVLLSEFVSEISLQLISGLALTVQVLF